ncbi:ribonuclease HI [Thioflexithrix psekupsensis]|uniref:Ribonuclease H n=1 Tax=Thioflexithrix psekupsensis TaxID=1570016 RepID=A0A251X3J5_9GAMM|nr:ribonuclease HI [Thioflexithrix psekupsensis]OUD12073.1 ribonuclease HI [Thioflexithrix psekupsensis]
MSQENQPKIVEAFTDGGCRGNPGVGGWGVLLRYGAVEKRFYGAEAHTTNNRMELMAAIMALEKLTRPCTVRLTTDSKYVQQGITEWIHDWIRVNWLRKSRPIMNVDLWQRLHAAAQRHHVEWCWVRGHQGHRENDIADALANQAMDEFLQSSTQH